MRVVRPQEVPRRKHRIHSDPEQEPNRFRRKCAKPTFSLFGLPSELAPLTGELGLNCCGRSALEMPEGRAEFYKWRCQKRKTPQEKGSLKQKALRFPFLEVSPVSPIKEQFKPIAEKQ